MLSLKIKLCVLAVICHLTVAENSSSTPNVWYIEPTINRNANGVTVAYSLNGTSWLLDLTDVALKEVPMVFNKNGVITEQVVRVLRCAFQGNESKTIDELKEKSSNFSENTQDFEVINLHSKHTNVTICNEKSKWMLTVGQDSYVFTVLKNSNQSDSEIPKVLVYGLSGASIVLLLLASCLVYCKCSSSSAAGWEDYHIIDICLTNCCKF